MILKKITAKSILFLASNKFFCLVLLLFLLQASWLAISASYPLLYDEYYHPGLIDIYSRQYSPFINSQTPEQVSIYMDITRVPSYLYHYLLSFPYRLITQITDSFYASIVSLRLINVFFVIAGLIFFRRLILLLGVGKATAHSAIFIFSLLPVFVHLAAHVNYDNLLFLLTPIFLIYGLKIINTKKVNITNILIFLAIGIFASLVKYTFIPIFLPAFIYVTFSLYKTHKNSLPKKALVDFQRQKTSTKILLVVLILLSTVLLVERYGFNLMKFGNIQPKCEAIHSLEDCIKQPILNRNYSAREDFRNNDIPVDNVVEYTRTKWIPAMVTQSIFSYANTGADESFMMTTRGNDRGAPIPILEIFIWVALFMSLIYASYSWRELKKMPNFWLFISIFSVYFFSVWIYTNYMSHLRTGQAFAMQPRYFLPLLPILFGYIFQSFNYSVKSRSLKLSCLIIVSLIFTQGGGFTTYIVRSNEGWYWQRENIINTNMRLRDSLKTLIKEE